MNIWIRRIGIGLILLLILANVWKWWSSADKLLRNQDTPQGRLFSVEDFQVHGLTVEHQSKSERDLFRLGTDTGNVAANESSAGTKILAARPKVAVVVQPVVVPPTPEELAVAASRAQLAQIKCIGVLFQENKKPEAYMLQGNQPYVVRTGDMIGQQFVVEKITIEAVYLKDPQTGVTATVPVDGREGSITK